MNQNCSDLMAALKKQGGIEFIKAANVQEAIDRIEMTMGKAWASARGRRRVAHQLLDDCFTFVTRYTIKGANEVTYVDTYASEVDGVYYDADGNILEPVKGYRPLTVAERQEQTSRADLKRVRREAEKAKPRHHREGSSRVVKRRLVPEFTSEKRFGHLVARVSGTTRTPSGLGDLSLG